MEIKYKNIVLRDYCESDIEDEIRWMNVETAWMKADNPWEPIQPVCADELREDMLNLMHDLPADAVRSRLEIDTSGNHIGFVCSYPLDENYEPIAFVEISPEKKIFRAIGIEICEPRYWCQGLGTQALKACVQYYLDNGSTNLCLETWSGNIRMLKCAEKAGFVICKRDIDVRLVNGTKYDAITLQLDLNKFQY